MNRGVYIRLRDLPRAQLAAAIADPRNRDRIAARLARYVDPAVCWLWSRRPMGYGNFAVLVEDAHTVILAHRFVLMLKLGRPLDGLACQSCDVPACVNPAHLFEGTHQDNMRDAVRKGSPEQRKARQAECIQNAVLTRS